MCSKTSLTLKPSLPTYVIGGDMARTLSATFQREHCFPKFQWNCWRAYFGRRLFLAQHRSSNGLGCCLQSRTIAFLASILSFYSGKEYRVLGHLSHEVAGPQKNEWNNTLQQQVLLLAISVLTTQKDSPRKIWYISVVMTTSLCNQLSPTNTPCRHTLKALLVAQSNTAVSRSCVLICLLVSGQIPL